MAHTPQKTTINTLLQGLNNGLNLFKKAGGPRIDSEASSDEDEGANGTPTFLNSNANGIASVNETDNNVHVDKNINNLVSEQATSIDVSPQDVAMAKGKKKLPLKPTKMGTKGYGVNKNTNKNKNPSKNKSKEAASKGDNGSSKSNDPAVDPPRKKITNPLDMEEAFYNGYDSDGWEGPTPGTDPKEVAALDKGEAGAADLAVPTHVPISDDGLKKLTVDNIKHELEIRNVGLP